MLEINSCGGKGLKDLHKAIMDILQVHNNEQKTIQMALEVLIKGTTVTIDGCTFNRTTTTNESDLDEVEK